MKVETYQELKEALEGATPDDETFIDIASNVSVTLGRVFSSQQGQWYV